MKQPAVRSNPNGEPKVPAGRQDAAKCVVIGGSAGAIEALLKILPAIPASFPLPILAVVHLPPEGKSLLPEIFGPRCQVLVKEAEDKEVIRGGTVYFAAPNYHLLVEVDRTLSLSSDEPVLYSRPSIDVLFETAADAFGSGALAVVLTGANNDGSAGAKKIWQAGGQVWVQSPESADSSLMPKSTLELCPHARQIPIADLGRELASIEGTR